MDYLKEEQAKQKKSLDETLEAIKKYCYEEIQLNTPLRNAPVSLILDAIEFLDPNSTKYGG